MAAFASSSPSSSMTISSGMVMDELEFLVCDVDEWFPFRFSMDLSWEDSSSKRRFVVVSLVTIELSESHAPSEGALPIAAFVAAPEVKAFSVCMVTFSPFF